MRDTQSLAKLLEAAERGDNLRGLLLAVREKLDILIAAQQAAKNGANAEQLAHILDEDN